MGSLSRQEVAAPFGEFRQIYAREAETYSCRLAEVLVGVAERARAGSALRRIRQIYAREAEIYFCTVAREFRCPAWPPTSLKYLLASPRRSEGWQLGVQEYDSRSSPRCTVTTASFGACTLIIDSAMSAPPPSSAIRLVRP